MSSGYMNNITALSKIAVSLSKQDETYIEECKSFIAENDDECGYIWIGEILFSYYMSQLNIASTDDERQLVYDTMMKSVRKTFNGKYLSPECWTALMHIRYYSADVKRCFDDVVLLIEFLKDSKYDVTKRYIYGKIANYIINDSLFFVEPYTTILSNIIDAIDGAEFDPSKQPNYLS